MAMISTVVALKRQVKAFEIKNRLLLQSSDKIFQRLRPSQKTLMRANKSLIDSTHDEYIEMMAKYLFTIHK